MTVNRMTAHDPDDGLSHWRELFDKADAEWAALMAKEDKKRGVLPPGHRWQFKRVRRGNGWAQVEVAVPIGEADRMMNVQAQQKLVERITAPLRALQEQMEIKWGRGRLHKLVSVDTAARFASAETKWHDAIASNDSEAITKRTEVMMRGWAALEREALEAGASPDMLPQVWEGVLPTGKSFYVVRMETERPAAVAQYGLGVWTLKEIGLVLHSFDTDGFTQRMKDDFGSELIQVGGEPPF